MPPEKPPPPSRSKYQLLAKSKEQILRDGFFDKDEEKEKVCVNPGRNDLTNVTTLALETDPVIKISVSDTSLRRINKWQSRWNAFLWRAFGVKRKLTEDEFEEFIRQITVSCLVHSKDHHELHVKRTDGVRLIDEVLDRAEDYFFTVEDVTHIFFAILSCIHHFQMRLKCGSGIEFTQWSRKKQYQKCLSVFQKILKTVSPELLKSVMNAAIVFVKEAKIWDLECISTELLFQVFEYSYDKEDGIADLLTVCESRLLSDVKEAKQILYVISTTIEKLKSETISSQLMDRFLTLFNSSVTKLPYFPLKTGLDLCIKKIILYLNNDNLISFVDLVLNRIINFKMTDEILVDFGDFASYAAYSFESTSYKNSIPENILLLLFDLMSSDFTFYCLLGNRIFQKFIDIGRNSLEFESPRFYSKNAAYNIKLNRYTSFDKKYFRQYRNTFHNKMFVSIITHINRAAVLKVSYTTWALILTSLPCGYTAASAVCFAMAMQEFALGVTEEDEVSFESIYHLHAFAMGIMSLVCHIHKAEIFYEYVHSKMQIRSEWAPHLNPPFKRHYDYAEHHVLWNKPELFFEDWEARYGLWKCFRSKKIVLEHFRKHKEKPLRVDTYAF